MRGGEIKLETIKKEGKGMGKTFKLVLNGIQFGFFELFADERQQHILDLACKISMFELLCH